MATKKEKSTFVPVFMQKQKNNTEADFKVLFIRITKKNRKTMKRIIKISLMMVAFLSIMTTAQAQKFGYLNSQLILSEMPAVKEMQSNLQALQTQLQKQGQGMVESYKKEEEAAVRKKQQGQLAPVEEEKLMTALQKKQEEILTFEKEMQKKLSDKEQQLLEPILTKINTAIKDVASENGFDMIFEQGVLLFATETTDVSSMVRGKLGL